MAERPLRATSDPFGPKGSSPKGISLRGVLGIGSLGALAVFFVVSSALGTLLSWHPIPFWDAWDSHLSFWLDSDTKGFEAWWRQHNEHRLVVAKALFLLDFAVGNGEGFLLLLLNVLFFTLIAVTMLALLRARVRESQDTNPSLPQLLMSLLIVVFSVSWLQEENFTWGIQVQALLAVLLPVIALLLLGFSLTPGKQQRQSALFGLSLVFQALSVFTMSGGLVVPFVAALVTLLVRGSLTKLLAQFSLGIILSVVYLFDWSSPGTTGHSNPLETIWENPTGVAPFLFRFLGGPFEQVTGSASLGEIFGILFALIVLVSLFRFVKTRPKFFGAVSLGVMIYVLLNGVLIALGRMDFGLVGATPSRYQTLILAGWAAGLILNYEFLSRFFARLPAMSFGTVLLIVGLFLPPQIEALKSPTQMLAGRDLATLAIALGVPDGDAIGVVYPTPERPIELAKQARAEGVTGFSEVQWVNVVSKLGTRVSLVDADCLGSVDVIEDIPGTGYSRVTGWVSGLLKEGGTQFLVIADRTSRVTGFAVVGFNRPDVEAAIPSASGQTGFVGYVIDDSSDPVHFVTDGVSCTLVSD